jgi:hypothetical protein
VLYGAGPRGRSILRSLGGIGITPAYFVDQNHGREIATNGATYPVKAPAELLQEDKTKLRIIISTYNQHHSAIKTVLGEMGLLGCLCEAEEIDRGLGEKSAVPYCLSMEKNLHFATFGIAFCCYFDESRRNPPRVAYIDSPQDFAREIISYREKCSDIITVGSSDDANLIFHEKCLICPYRIEKRPPDMSKLDSLSIGNYPSYCNCSCVYCNFSIRNQSNDLTNTIKNSKLPLICDTIPYLEEAGLIWDNTAFMIVSGEITVSPFKEKVYAAMQGRKVSWLSNCFVYDSNIAENLKANKESLVNISIDAGTPEAWHKVKGFPNFYEVVENLKLYHKAGKITLKFIILPGINDTIADYKGVAELMLALDVPVLTISKNRRKPLDKAHIDAYNGLVSVLKGYGLKWVDSMLHWLAE